MQLYPTSPVVLDGGLGTMLEELVQADAASPLWSAQQILDNPEAVVEAHLAFMRAGARIFLTATYQASLETFNRAGYSDVEAKNAMLKAVRLSDDARACFVNETDDPDLGPIKVALSLGPFGACLLPPQEFNGYYPPPYGPLEFSDRKSMYNSFDEDAEEEEHKSIQALTQFHLDRLLVFARDSETWGIIDIIAFETIPLVREVVAIRKAMISLKDVLAAEGMDLAPKPWWISFVLPNGSCPETQFPGGPNLTIGDLVSAALVWIPTEQTSEIPVDSHMQTPTGIGINCTSPELIPRLVQEITTAVEEFRGSLGHAPWLALYPDGGDLFDIMTRSWVAASEDRKYSWAPNLKKIIDDVSSHHPDVWGGFVVGGCCRTGPDQIGRLKAQLSTAL